jgi:hypothetical protein
MKRNRIVTVIAAGAVIAVAVAGYALTRPGEFDLTSTEEPICSLVKPFQSIDASQLMDGGSVVLGVQDARGELVWLFAEYDHSTGGHTRVFRRGVDCDGDPADLLTDSAAALADMKSILREHYPNLDEGSRDALRVLEGRSRGGSTLLAGFRRWIRRTF